MAWSKLFHFNKNIKIWMELFSISYQSRYLFNQCLKLSCCNLSASIMQVFKIYLCFCLGFCQLNINFVKYFSTLIPINEWFTTSWSSSVPNDIATPNKHKGCAAFYKRAAGNINWKWAIVTLLFFLLYEKHYWDRPSNSKGHKWSNCTTLTSFQMRSMLEIKI